MRKPELVLRSSTLASFPSDLTWPIRPALCAVLLWFMKQERMCQKGGELRDTASASGNGPGKAAQLGEPPKRELRSS